LKLVEVLGTWVWVVVEGMLIVWGGLFEEL